MTQPTQPNGNREAGYTAATLDTLTRDVREIKDMLREFTLAQQATAVNAATMQAAMVALAARVEQTEKKVEAWQDHEHPDTDEAIDGLKRRDWVSAIAGVGAAIGAALTALRQ